ncbi:MAG: heme transporter CcmD [Bacteroidetes bacterium OLB12]|nr:MAG: heme transporter CcmD [Bacteroidetes bacterium OLB12]HNR75095.1 cytochrome c oxidase subunit II [Cyclobacteriaceae bacterium]
MLTLIIVLGVLLVLAILYFIFRIGNLVSLVKGKDDSDISSSNSVNAYLLMLFMIVGLVAFFWYSIAHFDSYNLPVASEHGVVTDYLFWVTMAVTVVAFTLIFIVMFWFTFKYRYDKNRRADFFADNHKLEIVWTLIPAFVLALLIFSGLRAWSDITDEASKDAVVVEVIGQQFMWTARYPGKDNLLGKHNYKMIDASNEFGLDLSEEHTWDDFKSLELHLPKGKEVKLMIRAKDVIHSVFLPHFRVKMDAVPGMHTTFKFTVTKSTADMRSETGNPNFNYEMACAEICGRGHFSMRFPVFVHDSVEDYENWLKSQDAWLKQNPDYLKQVPAEKREAAIVKAGIPADSQDAIQAAPVTVTLN